MRIECPEIILAFYKERNQIKKKSRTKHRKLFLRGLEIERGAMFLGLLTRIEF